MRNFPTTVFDNFFDDPDKIVNYANTLEYYNDEFHYPAFRTKSLNEIDPFLNEQIIHKIVSTYLSVDYAFEGNVCFQKNIEEFKTGAVHRDLDVDLSCIVYLTKNSISDGTSFYSLKNDTLYHSSNYYEKHELIKNNAYEEFENYAKETKKDFDLDLTVKAKYNRALIFEGNEYHSASDLKGNLDGEDRMTMLAFIHFLNVSSGQTPISKSKRITL